MLSRTEQWLTAAAICLLEIQDSVKLTESGNSALYIERSDVVLKHVHTLAVPTTDKWDIHQNSNAIINRVADDS